MPSSPPDLFGTLDYRAYLKDWVQAKKKENPSYSHRVFARLSGQKSPSFLLAVIGGKRNLTSTTLEGFCRALGLDREEAIHFADLVALDQEKSEEKRNHAWQRISARKRFRSSLRIEGDSFAYLSHWYLPAIRELAGCKGFQADPLWIAKSLRPKVTVSQAKKALATLFSLGLLEEVKGGGVAVAGGSVSTPHEVAGLAVHNYHRGMLLRGGEAITAFAPEERHFCGVTVSIPEALVGPLKDEINAFQERILDLCDSSTDAPERAYQVGIQLFPLSVSVSRESQ